MFLFVFSHEPDTVDEELTIRCDDDAGFLSQMPSRTVIIGDGDGDGDGDVHNS